MVSWLAGRACLICVEDADCAGKPQRIANNITRVHNGIAQNEQVATPSTNVFRLERVQLSLNERPMYFGTNQLPRSLQPGRFPVQNGLLTVCNWDVGFRL